MRAYLLIILLVMPFCIVRGQEDGEKGFLLRDSLPQKMSVSDYRFHPRQLILPASLITVGAIGSAVDGLEDFYLLSRRDKERQVKADDYLEWGMLGWVFLCDLIGKEKHNWVDQLFLIGIAEALNAGMVQGVKRTIKTERPDGTPRAFPSGHTANAFLGAHIAYKEFRETSPALAYSGYAIAAFVAGSRLYNNRHWVADVVAGAGFGILSVELSYLIYIPIRNSIARSVNKKAANRWVVAPMLNQQGGGFYFSYSF